jgi:hypothetical protein
MRYTIQWSEVKKEGEKNGKPWKITTMHLRDENGNLIEGVDTFDPVMSGSTLEGEITQGQYGKNFKTAKAVAGSNFKAAQTEKLMEKKEQSISKFQDNKEWSIKLASSMGKAVDLAIASLKQETHVTDSMFGESIMYWRKWILNNWDINPTDLAINLYEPNQES